MTHDLTDFLEGRLDDADTTFTSVPSDPMNGMTRAGINDSERGIVFSWNGPASLEFEIPLEWRNLTGKYALSFRCAQATRHPNTIAELGELVFAVELVDGQGRHSEIAVDAYGEGITEPYQRSGSGSGVGWMSEFRSTRIPLRDFQSDGSAIDLTDIVALRFAFGGNGYSAIGRLGMDDIEFCVD